MAASRLIKLYSVADIRGAAAAWDDLWQRSEVALPIARAELIGQWIEHCAPKASVRAMAIQQDGQLIAALPLIGGRLKTVFPVGRLPMNDWSWAGDLLLDPSANVDAALETLIAEIVQLGWPLLWFDAVPYESRRWRRFIAAAEARGLALHTGESFRVGQVDIDHDWTSYRRRWSKNHRRQMRRIDKCANSAGGAMLSVRRQILPEQVEPLLRRGFGIEDSGWKGAEGTSVLKSPERFALHLRQARLIAERGELQLAFLEVGSRPIAFEYGWNSKGVYHSFKVGYDEKFADLTPGQMLRHRLLERFFSDPGQQTFDFLGPISPATSKWATTSYPVGRLVVSTGRLSGRMLLHAYRSWRPFRDRSRDERQSRSATDVAETEFDQSINPVNSVNPVNVT